MAWLSECDDRDPRPHRRHQHRRASRRSFEHAGEPGSSLSHTCWAGDRLSAGGQCTVGASCKPGDMFSLDLVHIKRPAVAGIMRIARTWSISRSSEPDPHPQSRKQLPDHSGRFAGRRPTECNDCARRGPLLHTTHFRFVLIESRGIKGDVRFGERLASTRKIHGVKPTRRTRSVKR